MYSREIEGKKYQKFHYAGIHENRNTMLRCGRLLSGDLTKLFAQSMEFHLLSVFWGLLLLFVGRAWYILTVCSEYHENLFTNTFQKSVYSKQRWSVVTYIDWLFYNWHVDTLISSKKHYYLIKIYLATECTNCALVVWDCQ